MNKIFQKQGFIMSIYLLINLIYMKDEIENIIYSYFLLGQIESFTLQENYIVVLYKYCVKIVPLAYIELYLWMVL